MSGSRRRRVRRRKPRRVGPTRSEEREGSTRHTLRPAAVAALGRRAGPRRIGALLKQPLRLVQVQGSSPDQVWVLATNVLDLSAELIAIAYHHRWQIELFFRRLKCVLGCRHLLNESQTGVTLPMYCAIIAALRIGLWVGVKPNKRTYEMLCHYLSG